MKKDKVIDLNVLKQTADNDLLELFPKHIYGLSFRKLVKLKRKAKMKPKAENIVAQDRAELSGKVEELGLKRKYKEALKELARKESLLKAVVELQHTVSTHHIEAKKSTNSSVATAVWVASDWHTDEVVEGNTVNNLNHFNRPIAERRVDNFFSSGLRLTNILGQDVQIDTICLALLGDFYTGHIHPDFMELTDTQPIHAVIRVQNLIASGIQFILDNSKYNLVIPCHSGNHARTTETTRFATESGHSLEFYMYNFLADHFKGEKRVKFIIPTGYHSYLDIYGFKIRFHHGHAIRYGGGVGGIYIPVNKAIAQWNKAFKVDLDVFGHFHQMRDGGNFICNGSLIGYSSFALSIKADYEKPKQTLFLVDSKRGKTCCWPILV